MIASIWLWMRRGTPGRAFIALAAMQIVLLFSRSGWWHEWNWALVNASSVLTLTGPIVAGLIAHDRGRRARPTIDLLSSASPRGGRALAVIGIAGGLALAGSWLLGLLTAVALAARDASGFPDLGFVPESLSLMALCVAAGLAVGRFSGSILVGPLTAIGMYAAGVYLPEMLGLHLTGLFQVSGTTGTLIALRPTPAHLEALVACHLSLTALLLVLALCVPPARWGRGWRLIVVLSAAGALSVASLFHLDHVASRVDPLQWSGGPDLCVGAVVSVCGPTDGAYVINASQKTISEAVTRLDPSGIDWQHNYLIPHSHRVPADRALLDVNPEDIKGGRIDSFSVAAALATPRNCRAWYSEKGDPALSKKQEVVTDWVTKQLGQKGPIGTAPASVRVAYASLRSCDPKTWIS